MDVAETVDARGTVCPIPIIRAAERLATLEVGQVLEVLATDEAVLDDLPAWCRATRHDFLGVDRDPPSPDEPPTFRGYVRRAHQ